MEEWGVSWEQVTGSGGTPGGGGAYSDASILSSLYQVLVQNEKDLEQAQSDYEDAVANAAFELQTLQLSLPSLEQAVTEAKENYEVQAGQAKLTYEQTLATAERAESDYETALEKAESDYETLKSDYEDARDNLELFENSVGDGYFYASGSGTILRVMAQAEQELTEDSVLFLYSNPEEMSVTVSVDQTDIAKLTVGEEAYVMTSGGSGYSGSIAAVYPVTSSECNLQCEGGSGGRYLGTDSKSVCYRDFRCQRRGHRSDAEYRKGRKYAGPDAGRDGRKCAGPDAGGSEWKCAGSDAGRNRREYIG